MARGARLKLASSRPASATSAQPGTIAVLSHHATFAMQMRRAGFDVREGRDVDELAALADAVDVLVVDLVAIEGRRGLVGRLSTSVDAGIPLVLVSADDVDVALLGPGRSVHVVVPPVRAEDVVSCVRRVLAEDPTGRRSVVRPTAPEPEPDRAVPGLIDLTSATGVPASAAAAAAPSAASAPSGSTPPERPVVSAVPTGPPWQVLAEQLLLALRGIPSLPAAAQALAEEVAQLDGADVAVLARDENGRWRVEGGVGLRSFEWGQTVEDPDWLVVTGRERHATLVVPDTDTVRGDLVGVPLASRRQFIRTHSRRTDVMACAGWSVAGEQRDRVAGLTAALKHHENAIAEALELRALVSALVRQVEGIDAFLG